MALEGVLTPALGPQPDGGIIGAGQKVAVRQHQHGLYRPLVACQLSDFTEVWPCVHPDRPASHAPMLGNQIVHAPGRMVYSTLFLTRVLSLELQKSLQLCRRMNILPL